MADLDRVLQFAGRQDGVVSAAQALSAGFSRDRIRQLCRSGRWIRVGRGCFLPVPGVGSAALRRARIRAAVASLGPGACAVLDTAAELHRIAGLQAMPTIHVSVPPGQPRPQRLSNPDLVVHQLTFEPADIGGLSGLRWKILRFTWSDTLRPDYIPETVKNALRTS